VPIAVEVVGLFAWQAQRARSFGRLGCTLLVATLVAWPFYAYDGVRYLEYARFAGTWPLDQLPASGHLDFAGRYLRLLTLQVFGFAIVVLPAALVVATRSLLRPPPDTASAMAPPAVPATAVPAMANAATAQAAAQRRSVGIACGLMVLSTLIPHVFGHNQNPRYLLAVLPVGCLLLASAGAPLLASVAGAAGGLQAVAGAAIMLLGPLGARAHRHDALVGVSWRENVTCDYAPLLHALPASLKRPVIRFFGVSGIINHVQIELAFVRAGVLAHVEPADLAAGAGDGRRGDPTRTDAALVVVAHAANDGESHRFVADPNRNLHAILERFRHDPDFVLAPVQVGGPAGSCSMSVFVPRHGETTVARAQGAG